MDKTKRLRQLKVHLPVHYTLKTVWYCYCVYHSLCIHNLSAILYFVVKLCSGVHILVSINNFIINPISIMLNHANYHAVSFSTNEEGFKFLFLSEAWPDQDKKFFDKANTQNGQNGAYRYRWSSTPTDSNLFLFSIMIVIMSVLQCLASTRTSRKSKMIWWDSSMLTPSLLVMD